jgi:hypothetical protein
MVRVTSELAAGLKSLGNIVKMLEEAICGATGVDSAKFLDDQEYIGFYFDDKRFFVGINYEEPEVLLFETQRPFRLRADAKKRANCGEVKADEIGLYWEHKLEIYSPKIRFFQQSKDGQLKCLERFLAECLAVTKRIEGR